MTSKPGLVEMAENGTLFLDEFTEASTRVQAKLLRVLQERCFHRVGGTQTISVNFRLIAASNRDITHAVRQGLFRADLYYRIAVINLKIPPLRERKADILAIARYYLHFFFALASSGMRSGFFSGKPPYPGKLELAGEYTRAAQRHRAVGCLDRGATPDAS